MKNELTKEKFKKIFGDNFEMTNYAIQMAQQQIFSGNENLNITQLLEDIKKEALKPSDEKELDEKELVEESSVK